MCKMTEYKINLDDMKVSELFSADQIEGIELSGGEDEEFGDEIL